LLADRSLSRRRETEARYRPPLPVERDEFDRRSPVGETSISARRLWTRLITEVNRRATLLWLELSRERRWRGCAPRRSGCGRAPKSRSPRPAPRRRPGDEGGVEASVGLAGAHRSPAERTTNPTLRSLVTGNPTQPPGAMPAPRRGLASSMRGSVERAHDSIVAAKPRGAASRQGRKAGAFSGAGRKFGRKHRAPDMAHLQPVSGVKLACRTVDKGGAAINLLFATQILCQSSAS
jgi:hypothetical protein